MPRTRRPDAKTRPPLLALVLAAALAGCGSGEAGSEAVRRDSAGVEIVEYRAGDRPLDVAVSRSLSLGGRDAGPESFFDVTRRGLATDGAGRIYVLDEGNRRVVVFDSAGAHVRTLGAGGGGPGELQRPNAVAASERGAVRVYDMGKRAVVAWGPDGEHLGEAPVDDALLTSGLHLEDDPEGPVLSFVRRPLGSLTGGDEAPATLVRVAGGDTTTLLSAPSVPETAIQVDCAGPRVRFHGTSLFSPDLRWDAAGSHVVAVRDVAYRVEWFRDGRRVRSVRRALAPRETSPEMGVRHAEGMGNLTINVGNRTLECDVGEFVEQRGMAPHLPVVAEVALDPAGRLWVRRRSAPGEDPAPIDLFDPRGTYLGSVPGTDVPFPAAFLPDGRIVALREDELGVQRVEVVRVEGIPG